MRVGIGMAMIGEFSFVIASLGAEQGVTSPFLLPIAVAVSATTALITPPLIRHADPIISWMSARAPRPAKDFAHMYAAWLGRAKRHQNDENEAFHGRYDMGALLRAVSYGAVLVASAVVARFANDHLVAVSVPGRSGVVTAMVFGAWVLVAIPIVIGLARAVRELVDNLVFVVVPPRLTTAGRGHAAAAVLRNTLYAFLAILVTLIGVAAGAAFLPPLPLLLGALVVVAIAAIVLRGSLQRLNRQIEQAVDVVFQAEPPAGQRDQVLSLIRERYPWDMHVQSVIVPGGSRAAHRRIRDLQLPQKTGASIVSHERDGNIVVNPPPDTLILPGDGIGILGEEEQVADARSMLTSDALPETRPVAGTEHGVQIEEIDITPASPLAGHTLAGSRLREKTGASIVGLRREGVPILNPAPVLRLQPGDTVVVLGSPQQVTAARKLFDGA
jgi:CPA2 family monovalent cation:H+ antiporter-2